MKVVECRPHVLVATISIACIMLFIYNLSVKGPLSGVSSNSRSLPRDFSFEKYKPGKMASSVNIPASEMHDKWIVITSINYPTEDVKKLANIPGWRMVMVGDTKSPKDWSYPNVVFLDVEKQRQLGYKIHDMLEYKSYPRKNIGYLYAIQHGAKIIYETDDDNSPSNGKIEFDQHTGMEYYVYDDVKSTVVNPFAHFGQNTIWPRGYPLDKISEPVPRSFRKCKNMNALVQQGVVDGDPDVDAIFRLTRKDAGVNLHVTFDKTAPPVLLPRGVMTPYNTQNTLHLYDAFWGLVMSKSLTFRVVDIWRGFWAQRLMWEIGSFLAIFPPNAVQFRNPHSFLSDFIEEKHLYHLSSDYVEFLAKWKTTKTNFLDMILELSWDMVDKGFWHYDDAIVVQYWLEDLLAIGYKPPALKKATGTCDSPVVMFTPKEQPSSFLRLGKNNKNIL